MTLHYLFACFFFFAAIHPSSVNAQEPFFIDKAELDLESIFMDALREKMLRNYDKALGFLDQILEKDPLNAAVMHEKARILEAQNKNQDALTWALKAVERDAENSWFQVFLADLYQKQDLPLEAAKVYEALVQRSPENNQYTYKWAYFLVAGNEVGRAITVYENLEKRIGVNEELSRRKHLLYLGTGDMRKAEQELLLLIASYPKYTEYLHLLAGFYEQTGQIAKAIDTYKKIEGQNPFDPKASLAIKRLDKGKSSDEVGYLRSLQAVFVKPEYDLDQKIMMLIPYIEQVAEGCEPEKAEEVLRLSNILVEVHPEEAKVYALRGDIHFHTGSLEKAAADYERTLALNQGVFQVWEQLMYTYTELRETQKLLEKSEQALDVFPNQGSLYYFNALSLSWNNKPDEAIRILEQASFMIPQNSALQLDVLSLQGKCYAQQGKLEKAEKTLRKALDAGANSNSAVLEKYGDVLFQLGNADEALSYWQKALEQGPETDLLKRKIADKRLYE